MSRYLTLSVARKNATANEKTYNSAIRGIISNASEDIDTPLITQNTKITIVFIIRLINAEIVPDTTMINFGKLILRIKSPRETIDCNPCTVASVKKFHNTIPTNKYTGKCSISLPLQCRPGGGNRVRFDCRFPGRGQSGQ